MIDDTLTDDLVSDRASLPVRMMLRSYQPQLVGSIARRARYSNKEGEYPARNLQLSVMSFLLRSVAETDNYWLKLYVTRSSKQTVLELIHARSIYRLGIFC